MAEKIVSLYTPEIEAAPSDEGLPQNFMVSRDLMGNLDVEWDQLLPTDVTIKIVRKERDYAYHVDDGTVIYEGPSDYLPGEQHQLLKDEEVFNCRTYYYVLFYKQPEDEFWKSKKYHRWYEVCTDFGEFFEALSRQLPQMYREDEIVEDNPQELPLLKDWIMAPVLEELEGLIDCFPLQYDVDVTPGENLRSLAELVGLEPNLELPYQRQRQEIKNAAKLYMLKGQPIAVQTQVEAFTGNDTIVDDWVDNILVSNLLEHGQSAIVTDPNEAIKTGMAGDKTGYALDFDIGEPYNTVNYGIYNHINPVWGLSREAVHKIARVVPKFSPASTLPNLIVVDIIYTEDMPVSGFEDDAFDEHITKNSDPWLNSRVLIANRMDEGSNDMDSLSLFYICIEKWWDEIITV